MAAQYTDSMDVLVELDQYMQHPSKRDHLESNPFDDEREIVAYCDTENPEVCESCT